MITTDAILSLLNEGPTNLDDMHRRLSHASYVGLRYQLARMLECGLIERRGELYRLKQKADSHAAKQADR
jgi:predicted transcriptional regulator